MFIRFDFCALFFAASGICFARVGATASELYGTQSSKEGQSLTKELPSKGSERSFHQHSASQRFSPAVPETCPSAPPFAEGLFDSSPAGTGREDDIDKSGRRERVPRTEANAEGIVSATGSGAVRNTFERPFDEVPHFLTRERWTRMTSIYGFGPLKPYCEICRYSRNFCTKEWDCREFCGEKCTGLGRQLTEELKCRWCSAEAARCVVWGGCREGCPEQCGPVLENRKKFFETGVDEMAEQERKQKLRRRLQLFREGKLQGTGAEELIRTQLQSSRPEDKQLQEVDREEQHEKEVALLRDGKETCRVKGIVSILAQGEQRAAEAADREEEIEQLDLDDDSEGPLWD
ncbi:conserved hypothetical protein [Neospora caninum Liverpool]|uniref:Transmembrane protein n=1 Tax=Neospora caninum (strain Liverpool) TaxID=572307 RepID=F0VI64_NEOCL|nr:conserved hypothetical protein [Neospora caninum Liverpool]CBZ53425.1 conserved hypothetical protein [Neospora caninum Liverpool]CEL67412.1 TPA: hypothetical protein BN1204_032120 [Neospora caninum Liverpool]|eukprot:XP_003883457.1 conserved hypothetical protein [Neospora caninum Liverpool]